MREFDVPLVPPDDLPTGAVLLDCREDYEWTAGHIDGAVHLPMNQIPQQLAADPGALTTDAHIVVVCKVGSRSAHVAAWLNHNGFDAASLDGGMLAWATSGLPMVSSDGAPPRVA